VKRVIVTGDDFGLAHPVNAAIERAHRRGVLGSASLMVAGSAASDAVERARRLPDLRVGLHLVVTRGRSVLSPREIPALVEGDGHFRRNLLVAGLHYYASSEARRQLALEIRAQFEAFAATGLELDHADAHNHMHLHPTILTLLIEIGRDFGVKAVRLPYEPLASWRSAPAWLLLLPWTVTMRRRLAAHGLFCNDYLFGMGRGGSIDGESLERIVRGLPDGVSEIHLHPATAACIDADPNGRHTRRDRELEALLSPNVRRAFAEVGAERVAYGTLFRSPGRSTRRA
jgi:hopanoid biosynthesis associated protein HpnK